MTRAEAAASSIAEHEKDKHSRSQPAGSSGPNKDSISHPDGASVLGTELGAESDARRDRAQALAEGDSLPPSNPSTVAGTGASGAGSLGFGVPNGAEQGNSDRSEGQRGDLQQERNQEFHSGQPDLRNIARTSGGAAATNPISGEATSTANKAPGQVLEGVGRSTGQPSGTGAYDGEIARDADTRE